MKSRMSLAALMLAISAVALGLAGMMEYRRWGPERRARAALIRAHRGQAANYDRELATPQQHYLSNEEMWRALRETPPTRCNRPHIYPMGDGLRQALLRLSAWHVRREAELRQAGRFDPDSERLRDRQSCPTPNDSEVYGMLGEYHYPRMW